MSDTALIPSGQDVASILRGLRNGLRYGVRIRAPHALVMSLLFHNSPLWKRIDFIRAKTWEHARTLGVYVAVYKTLDILIRRIRGRRGAWNQLVAGFVGGWIMFGTKTSVVHQINLYVFSRIVFGLIRLFRAKSVWDVEGKPFVPPSLAYRIFAAVTWSVVMFLFEHHKSTLVPSLGDSMEYLYHNEMPLQSLGLGALWNWLDITDSAA